MSEKEAAQKVGITPKEFRTKAVYKKEWPIHHSKISPRIYMYWVPDIVELIEQNSNMVA